MPASFKKNLLFLLPFMVLILFFLAAWTYTRFILVSPLRKTFTLHQNRLEAIRVEQKNQGVLLDQINHYRDGLFGLNLVLEARNQVQTGSDPDNPYLIFDLPRVMNDLKRLFPQDTRATKFQLTEKGLLTLPIESVDYASLGRMLKGFKDQAPAPTGNANDPGTPVPMFTEVLVPTGAQRNLTQTSEGGKQRLSSTYSLVIQAQLNPDYWKNDLPYPDLDPHAFYTQAVVDSSASNLVEGYVDGNFKADQPINRAEFLKLMTAQLQSTHALSSSDHEFYADPTPQGWSDRYHQFLVQMHWPQAKAFTPSTPDQTVTRLEALTLMAQLFKEAFDPSDIESTSKETSSKVESLPFTDLPHDQAAFRLIAQAYHQGLLDHLTQAFGPKQPVTRGEVTYWVWKLNHAAPVL